MLKLLRRYNKLILVFGGCLLMVLFLVPSLGNRGRGGGGGGGTIARFEGGKITQKEYMAAQRELQAIAAVRSDRIGMSIMYYLGVLLDPRSQNARRGVENIEHWILLSSLAKQAGLVGGPGDGRELLDVLASDLAPNFQVPVDTVRSEFNSTYDAAVRAYGAEAVDGALAKSYGIARLLSNYRGFSPLSRPETIKIAGEIFDKANADLLILPASAFTKDLPEITADRVNAHFAKYMSVKPQDNEFRIGYLRPPAVQLEWLTLDSAIVGEQVTVDPVEMNKFWRQNKAQFGEDFSAAKADVEREFRARETAKLIQRAREAVENRIKLSLTSVGKTKVVGDSQIALTMTEIETILKKALNAGITSKPLVQVTPATAEWYSAANLAKLPMIGESVFQVNEQNSLPFAGVVMSVKETGGTPSPLLQSVLSGLKLDVPFGPLVDQAGNLFYFRILAARPEGPPDSVSEIQEQITQDIRRLDGFEIAKKRAEALRAQMAEKGLSAMLNEASLSPRLVSNIEITRDELRQGESSQAFPDYNTPEFRDAVMDVVSKWDPTKEVSSLPAIDRVIAIPNDRSLSLVLVDIKSRLPVTKEQLKTGEGAVVSSARSTMLEGFTDTPFSFERLSETMKLKTGGATSRKEKAKEAAEPSTQESSPLSPPSTSTPTSG